MKFDILVNTIKQTHQHFQQQATKAVNVSLTLRNWLIGYYIVEYEQMGEDRAKYGERLVDSLAEKLNNKGLGNRNLKLFRQFYLAYPELNTAIAQLTNLPDKSLPEIMQLSTAQFGFQNSGDGIVQLPTAQFSEKTLFKTNWQNGTGNEIE